jgi:thiol-disulfide isomerase/thioredoxin
MDFMSFFRTSRDKYTAGAILATVFILCCIFSIHGCEFPDKDADDCPFADVSRHISGEQLPEFTATDGNGKLVSAETVTDYPFADVPGHISAEQFPDFTATDENGRLVSVRDLKGNVVIVALFTLWCANCPIVLRSLDELAAKLRKSGIKNVKIMALNVGSDPLNSVKIHYRAHDVAELEVYSSIAPTVMKNIRGVPACFVYDKKGTPVWGLLGATDYNVEEFIGFIKKLAEAI